mgnify:FL=1
MLALPLLKTNCLDEVRPVRRFYSAGEWDCPFCSNWSTGPTCRNPYCYAYPGFPAEMARRRNAEVAARRKEEEDRRRNHEWAMQRSREDNERHTAWEQEQIAEAMRRGACVRCLFQPGWERVKFTRHRKPCPKERME